MNGEDPLVLIVEDDPSMADIVEFALQTQGFRALVAHDGTGAMELVARLGTQIALVVLDVTLPDVSGFQVAAEIKREHPIPIMFLTARGESGDRIAGLELGAEDYVVKPFHPRELALRAQGLVRRRSGRSESGAVSLGSLRISPRSLSVSHGGRSVTLTASEMKLLLAMAEHPGRTMSFDDLVRTAWGSAHVVGAGTSRALAAQERP